jgi:hypothetical protein
LVQVFLERFERIDLCWIRRRRSFGIYPSVSFSSNSPKRPTMHCIAAILFRVPIFNFPPGTFMHDISRILRICTDLKPSVTEMTFASEAENWCRVVCAYFGFPGVVAYACADVCLQVGTWNSNSRTILTLHVPHQILKGSSNL